MSETITQIPEQAGRELTAIQLGVLSLVSQGQTPNQVARRLQIDRPGFHAVKDEICDLYGAESIAGAVNAAIEEGTIQVELKPDGSTLGQLERDDFTLLRHYARGGTNSQYQRVTNTDRTVVQQYQDRLLKRVRAWSQSHAVRRAHELGIFTINQQENMYAN